MSLGKVKFEGLFIVAPETVLAAPSLCCICTKAALEATEPNVPVGGVGSGVVVMIPSLEQHAWVW